MRGSGGGVDGPLAHSGRAERGVPPQPYWEHAEAVARGAAERARAACAYWAGQGDRLVEEVRVAGYYHDCGKLCPENQEILRGAGRGKLPVAHTDGGAALLLEDGRSIAAMLVRSHHAPGLPAVVEERLGALRRPPCPAFRDRDTLKHTSANLGRYRREYPAGGDQAKASRVEEWSGLTHRIALSCLVDADHTDTARHCEGAPAQPEPAGRWQERLNALRSYVGRLAEQTKDEERARQRTALFEACCWAEIDPPVQSCDAAVGTGKTTAVMAFLLRAAMVKGLRRIFVVLPYTNIIRQAVEVYRAALVLHGEDPHEVVAELHHLADFERPESRQLAVLWKSPVIVTTAVQFFETIAGNLPARLRKLHELPGSAVFIDEAHAAIPTGLWPQAWRWLSELSEQWGCRFVLGSGSLVRFWEIPGFLNAPGEVADLVPSELRGEMYAKETVRTRVRRKPEALDLKQTVDLIGGLPGPRLVILNTVQNAAVVAEELRKRDQDVLHLSTALTPTDRGRIVERVRARLREEDRRDWTLVATSCVEAGVDFSFRSAVRERCSAASLVQTGGRVNREGTREADEVWDVRLQDPLFNANPQFRRSREVLGELFEEGLVDRLPPAALVTEAMRRELLRWWDQGADKIQEAERVLDFVEVARLFRVIEGDGRLVVADARLLQRLRNGDKVTSRELLLGSVQMWLRKAEELRLRELPMLPGVYEWTAPYDPCFLGYMAGVLPLIYARQSGIYLQ